MKNNNTAIEKFQQELSEALKDYYKKMLSEAIRQGMRKTKYRNIDIDM